MDKNRILCFGDSNTWGYDGITGKRFGYKVRWPQVLQSELGSDYHIIEEGLCGRTTVFNDPLNNHLNGLEALEILLKTHAPIDQLIIMLGTNDTKERFSANAMNIIMGLEKLLNLAKISEAWRNEVKMFILAPIIIDERIYNTEFGLSMGKGCARKSQKLVKYLETLSKQIGTEYFDINEFCTVNKVDYMHLDEKSHQLLGIKLSKIITGRE